MEKPKLDSEKFRRCVESGQADDYLAAHSQRAAVFAPGNSEPHAYDVLLDADASDELFRSFTDGKGSLKDASQEELLAFVTAMQGGEKQNPWKALAIKSALIIGALIVFIVVIALMAVQK